jgi:hypothetical protein
MSLKNKIGALFRSVKLTVVLLSLVALTCMVGTIVSQSPFAPIHPGERVSVIGKTVQWYFRWHDIYRSPLLVTLIGLLAANVLVCSAKVFRRPTSRNLGFILTHASIVVILVGVAIGQIAREGGMMMLHEGDSGTAVERDDGTTFDMGFSVALDEFVIEYYDSPTERLVVLRAEKEQVLPVVVGREYRLRDGSSLLRITDRVPHAAMTASIVEDKRRDINPAIRISMEGHERNASGWLFAKEDTDTPFFDNAVSIRYLSCGTEQEYHRALLDAATPGQERLMVRVPGVDTVETFPVEIGTSFPVRDTDYVLEILRYLPDFSLDPVTGEPINASDEPRNPAIEVKLSDGERSLKRWAFALFPEFSRAHSGQTERAVELAYVVPAKEMVRIVDIDGRSTMLVRPVAGAPAEVETVQIGEEVQLGDTGWTFTLAERVARPRFVREVAPSRDPRDKPAVQVSIKESHTDVEKVKWLMTNMPEEIGTTRLLYSRQLTPKQYTSKVTFLEDGLEMKRGEVRVNAPLKYGGFAFYQSSYGKDVAEFTVLQVKRDPGVPVVYLGFLLLCSGLLYRLYARPRRPREASG